MKKVVVGLLFVFFSSVAFSYTESDKEPLFEMNGKKYYLNDLSLSIRNLLFDTEFKNYQMTSSVLEQVLLDRYFETVAAKKKIGVEKVMEQELKVDEPTEKEVKKFYESQRSSIPSSYTYEQLKPQLKDTLKREKLIEKRAKLVAKLKKQHKYKMLVQEPLPVVVNLDITGFPSQGNSKAKVKLVVFMAYGCVHCKHFYESLKKIIKKGKIYFVAIPFTLSPYPAEEQLVKGGICADKQNKFWQYLDMAFENQRTLSEESVKDFAKKLKLDMSKYDKCLTSSETQADFDKMKKVGTETEVSATPTIFINNKKYSGGMDVYDLEQAIEKEFDNVNGKK